MQRGIFLTSRAELLCMVELLAQDRSLIKLQLIGTKRKALYLKNAERGRHHGCYGLDSDVAHKCLVSLPCRRRPCKGSRRDQSIHNVFMCCHVRKTKLVDGSLRVMITRGTNSRTILCVEQIVPHIPGRKEKTRSASGTHRPDARSRPVMERVAPSLPLW